MRPLLALLVSLTPTAAAVKPSDPIWAGVTIYWQALLGNPLRFTNLEPTTLFAL